MEGEEAAEFLFGEEPGDDSGEWLVESLEGDDAEFPEDDEEEPVPALTAEQQQMLEEFIVEMPSSESEELQLEELEYGDCEYVARPFQSGTIPFPIPIIYGGTLNPALSKWIYEKYGNSKENRKIARCMLTRWIYLYPSKIPTSEKKSAKKPRRSRGILLWDPVLKYTKALCQRADNVPAFIRVLREDLEKKPKEVVFASHITVSQLVHGDRMGINDSGSVFNVSNPELQGQNIREIDRRQPVMDPRLGALENEPRLTKVVGKTNLKDIRKPSQWQRIMRDTRLQPIIESYIERMSDKPSLKEMYDEHVERWQFVRKDECRSRSVMEPRQKKPKRKVAIPIEPVEGEEELLPSATIPVAGPAEPLVPKGVAGFLKEWEGRQTMKFTPEQVLEVAIDELFHQFPNLPADKAAEEVAAYYNLPEDAVFDDNFIEFMGNWEELQEAYAEEVKKSAAPVETAEPKVKRVKPSKKATAPPPPPVITEKPRTKWEGAELWAQKMAEAPKEKYVWSQTVEELDGGGVRTSYHKPSDPSDRFSITCTKCGDPKLLKSGWPYGDPMHATLAEKTNNFTQKPSAWESMTLDGCTACRASSEEKMDEGARIRVLFQKRRRQ